MRRNAANAAAMGLALLCGFAVGARPLAAKPTRTLTRSARRPVLTEAVRHSDRSRVSGRGGGSMVRGRPAGEAGSGRRRDRGLSSSGEGKHEVRLRSLAQERAEAAQAAIDAADRWPHHRKVRRQGALFTPTGVLRHTRQPWRGDGAAMGETADADTVAGATTLTNVGGVLRATTEPLMAGSIANAEAAPLLLAPPRLSSLYDSGGRLILPRPLYGSHEILLHQNEMADRDGLDRVQDDADLLELRRERKLVALPESEGLRVDYRLPEDRRYSRPWTAAFLSLLAADFYATFHVPLQVDSAVRTVAVQRRLLRTNGNAAPTAGEAASPHLTGEAVDIAKGGLNLAEIAWMRTYLEPLIEAGKIDVEEEFQQSCFHISVYKGFVPSGAAHVSVATARQASGGNEGERPSD